MANQIIIRDVAFALPNATGDFTITDTGGPGLTPKGVIIVLSGATDLDTITNHARISLGFYDGTNQAAISWLAEHNVVAGNADTGRRRANDLVLNITGTTAQGLGVGVTGVSLGTNSVTINVDTASTLRGFVMFWYGSDLQVNVTTMSGNATQDASASTTAPGFTPDGVIAASPRNVFGADTGLDNAFISVGCAGRLPSITQACVGLAAEDREANTSVGCMPRNDRLISIVQSVAKSVTEVASLEVTSFDTGGLTIATRGGAESLGVMLFSFRLNGEKCHAACPTLNSNAAGVSSYTDSGFMARALMLIGQVATTVNTIATNAGAISIGVATTATGSHCAGWNDSDNQSTSVAHSLVSSSRMLDMPSDGTNRWWAASLDQITATGFDYDVESADTNDRPTVVFSIGEEPFAAAGGVTVQEAALSGSALLKFAATGAVTSGDAVLSGAALLRFAATGSVLSDPAGLAGQALLKFAASGALLLGDVALAGQALLRFAASGAIQPTAPSLSGQALLRFSAAGALQPGAAALAGQALLRFAATGALQSGPVSLSGSALLRFLATGQIVVPEAVLSGTATTSAAPVGAEAEHLVALLAARQVLLELLAGRDVASELVAGRDVLSDLSAARDVVADLSGGREIVYDLEASD